VSVAFWISLAIFAVSVPAYAWLWRGAQSVPQLRDVPPQLDHPWPNVSIVVAARDEEAAIEPALLSLMALDYPALEIVAVDDRSTDATASILDRVASAHPQLQVVHVAELPPGWLGKNNALHRGALRAAGDYILFMDADVVLEATTVKRAIAFCEARRLDHLTLFPDVVMRTAFLQAAMVNAFIGLLAVFRPWQIPAPPRRAIGAGAFNLVRADAYRRAGGHEPIAFETLDDVMLAQLVAARGARSATLRGRGSGHVEIYRNARDMVRGSEKNSYTFLDYSPAKLAFATALTLSLYWPWVAALAGEGATRWINVGTLAAGLALFAGFVRELGYGWRALAYWPVISLVMLAIMWRAVLLNELRGTIVWRGTAYPLAEVRRKHHELLQSLHR
jgi:glycosyltransferase involved in cell wall biosynthesis